MLFIFSTHVPISLAERHEACFRGDSLPRASFSRFTRTTLSVIRTVCARAQKKNEFLVIYFPNINTRDISYANTVRKKQDLEVIHPRAITEGRRVPSHKSFSSYTSRYKERITRIFECDIYHREFIVTPYVRKLPKTYYARYDLTVGNPSTRARARARKRDSGKYVSRTDARIRNARA